MLKLGSNQEFLSNEQINEICPSVFTSKPSTTVSEKYTHIPTSRVIEDMRSLGWDVVDAKQVQSRKEKTNGVGKHLVIFRNDDVVVSGSDGDTVYGLRFCLPIHMMVRMHSNSKPVYSVWYVRMVWLFQLKILRK
jgi:hypothetical protein